VIHFKEDNVYEYCLSYQTNEDETTFVKETYIYMNNVLNKIIIKGFIERDYGKIEIDRDYDYFTR
jgi:hypothetical protein